ncbi:unnamed protein product [Blepharisma stoltei]|uniref:Uncharacterized protein n=1 Tax=Blepharisma stoltei TaxID=1481888 RepID=A0AAU9KQA9_9CILI|nr:unnamed protein product [Blepharisma stoltei]
MNKYSHNEHTSSFWLQQNLDCYAAFITDKEIAKVLPVMRRTFSTVKFDTTLTDKRGDEVSSLSQIENRRVKKKSESIGRMGSRSSRDIRSMASTALEFNKIIKELDKVISNENYGQKRVILEEGPAVIIHLEEGESQLFTIVTAKKPIPLKVKLERKIGRKALTTYMSRRVIVPNLDQHETIYNRDEFDIGDIGLREQSFLTQKIYLNVIASEKCSFAIGINFGRIISKDASEIFQFRKKQKGTEEELLDQSIKKEPVNLEEDSLDQKYKKEEEISHSTDFIKRNVKRARSCIKLQDYLSEKRDSSELRRQNVITKHKEILTEHRLKGEIKIRKSEIKKTLYTQAEKVYKLYNAKCEFEKKWFSFMYFCKSVISLKENLEKRKMIAKKNLQSLFGAMVFQNAWKKYIKKVSFKELNMARARDLLKFYRFHAKKVIVSKAKHQLLMAVSHSKNHFKIPTFFSSYTTKVLLIQSTWKAYQKAKEYRFKQVNQLWNHTVDDIVNKTMNRKRKSKRYKTIVSKIVNIPYEHKKSTISTYLQDCMINYLKAGREPPSEETLAVSESTPEFRTRSSSRYGTFVNLNYIPNQETVIDMIKTAADIESPLKI